MIIEMPKDHDTFANILEIPLLVKINNIALDLLTVLYSG
jgi:hypothetical protein